MNEEIKKLRKYFKDNFIGFRDANNGGQTLLMEIPKPIIEFFQNLNFQELSIESFGDDIVIPSLNTLDKAQWGYSYNPKYQSRIENWPKNWIVISYQGSMPFIYNTVTEKVGFAVVKGEGNWSAYWCFENIVQFFWVIGITGGILVKDNRQTYENGIPKKMLASAEEMLLSYCTKNEVDECLKALSWK